MQSNLQKIGINNAREYFNGNWYGNSSKSGYEIFLDVTHNISDLIEEFEVKYESGRSLELSYASCFKTRDIGQNFFGRCFEIEVEHRNERVIYIKVDIKKPVLMYINLPQVFFSEIPSSGFQVSTAETLQLEVKYEILQTYFDDDCRKYSHAHNNSFDACKLEALDKNIVTKMNCSLPFLFKQNNAQNICKNVTVAQSAFHIYKRDVWRILPECPVPCINMITSFGYPIVTKGEEKRDGIVYIKFKNLVKVTEDFISYDLLRF